MAMAIKDIMVIGTKSGIVIITAGDATGAIGNVTTIRSIITITETTSQFDILTNHATYVE